MSTDEFAVNGVVRLHDRADVVSAVPFLLGFAPDDCLVVLALAEGRLEVTARLDLPTPDQAPTAATALAQALSHISLTDLLVVGYGPAADVDPTLTAFTAWLPWPVRDMLRVTDDRWWSLTCDTPDCCPPGAPVTATPELAAALIATSGSPATSRTDRAAALQPDDSVLDAVTVALDTVPLWSATQRYAALWTARHARREHRARLEAGEAARLLSAVADVRVRDACCGWRDTGALNVWQDLLPMAPTGWVAPVATLLALTAYQRGDGALAVLALERASGDDPGYTLARLLDQVIAYGLPPAQVTALVRQALAEHPLTDPSNAEIHAEAQADGGSLWWEV
jgi:hypothetical protein